VHNLVAKDVTAGVPTVSQPTIEQIHALVALSVITGIPLVTQGQLGHVHVLTAKDIESGVPWISTPELLKKYYTQLYEMRARMNQEMSEAVVLNTGVNKNAQMNREVDEAVLPLDRR
jgi:hypothetical protein